MNRIDELRETWEKAYKCLVKDCSDALTLEDIACMFFELGWRAADESIKVVDKHQKSVEAVRKHYNCDGKQYRCRYYDNCVFGDGENTPYNCCECDADEFFSGYMCALLDKEDVLRDEKISKFPFVVCPYCKHEMKLGWNKEYFKYIERK